MKSVGFLVCAGLLVFGSAAPARADEASKNAKIEEMLKVMHADQMIKQMIDQMQPMIQSQLSKMDVPAENKQAVTEMQEKMTALLSQQLSWEKMKPLYLKIYADTFSEEELEGVVAFYKSPAGQALLLKMPVLIQKTMTLTQEMMGSFIPEMTKLTQEMEKKYPKK